MELELYTLDTAIASNCGIVVSNGPAMGVHERCTDYVDPFVFENNAALPFANKHNVSFYDDTNCDCYTSGSGYGYWTS